MRQLSGLSAVIFIFTLCACGGHSEKKLSSAASNHSLPSSQQASSSQLSVHRSAASMPDPACPKGKPIVGYMPSWHGDVANIQYSYLTHILYAFALPNPDGSLQIMEQASINKLKALVSHAQQANIKVMIAVGGWNDGNDSAFVALSHDPITRAHFVAEIIDFVNTYDLDGVDIDWEYPSTASEAHDFSLLVAELRAALNGLTGHKLLTAAVVANGEHTGQYIQNIAFEQLDFLNIMAYDENNANHSSIHFAKASIDYWYARGVPREKIILGVPFYARPSWASYSHYVETDAENACRDQVDNNYYNGMATIRSKAAYSNSISCGVMVWELSQDTRDDTSLLRTIWEVVNDQPQTPVCQ